MSQQNIRNRKQGKNKNKNQNKHTPQSSSDNKKHSKPYINKQEAYNAWPTTFIVLIILLIIVYNELQFNLPSITQSISNKKPYRNVEDFYPYYLSEHSHPQDQRLHIFGSTVIVLIALIKPEVAITAMIGLLSGYIAFPLFRGIDHGLFEAAILASMAIFVAHMHGCKTYLLLVAVIGYGFAWVGHFFVEENKPATFIYPSYSLICDYKMFGAFYKQLLNTNNWEVLWDKGIDFNEALGRVL